MQIELTLLADDGADYAARELSYLLHKHPDHLHQRDTAAGTASIFFAGADTRRATAVLHLGVDPVRLVRGKSKSQDGLLDQYVNDRPYVANSFLSVALAKAFGQSMSGKSKERQALADRALPFEIRVTPVAIAGGAGIAEEAFGPLGYAIDARPIAQFGPRGLFDLRLAITAHLRDVLKHLYVLVPVLDNAKHWWIDHDEIDRLMEKGEGWLATHPAKAMIARRALKHRRGLVHQALARLEDEQRAALEGEAEAGEEAAPEPEAPLEQPIRLHESRLDRVAAVLQEHGARTVLDLGCGSGKLLARLVKQRGIDRMLGVDPSVRSLEVAARRLRLDTAGEALRARLALQLGSLTYGDRRWRGFDAATLVEVIEHIDPPRLGALTLSLFGDARPGLIVVTTPNREYNALFEGMAPDARRHPDHRFEWTRAEFESWAGETAAAHGYAVRFEPLGPVDETLGGPSQMAVFEKAAA